MGVLEAIIVACAVVAVLAMVALTVAGRRPARPAQRDAPPPPEGGREPGGEG
jgi:hypothetical protein